MKTTMTAALLVGVAVSLLGCEVSVGGAERQPVKPPVQTKVLPDTNTEAAKSVYDNAPADNRGYAAVTPAPSPRVSAKAACEERRAKNKELRAWVKEHCTYEPPKMLQPANRDEVAVYSDGTLRVVPTTPIFVSGGWKCPAGTPDEYLYAMQIQRPCD